MVQNILHNSSYILSVLKCPKPLPPAMCAGCVYLSAVLRLGHGRQELENGLRLRHQRGDGMDDCGEPGVRFDP